MIRWLGLPVLALIVSSLVFRYQMEWPWPLVALIALSIAALAYSTQRAVERMLAIVISEEEGSSSPTAPGGDHQ